MSQPPNPEDRAGAFSCQAKTAGDHDIAGVKNSDADLRQQVEQLTEANRNKDRFLDLLGHELRNPIAAISMAAEALSRLSAAEPDKRTMIDVICRQSRNASRLLDDMLEVVRLSEQRIELHKQRIDLVPHLRAAVDDCRARANERSVSVGFEIPPSPISIEADPIRLDKILRAVLKNGVELAGPDGALGVEVRPASNVEYILVEVQIAKCLIDVKALKTLFEPVHRQIGTQRDDKLLRLDLAVAKGLIELHGGRVEIAECDNGAFLRMLFPAAKEMPAETASDDSQRQRCHPLRILLIEDSGDIVASLQFLLQSAGHELTVAPNGQTGIESARQLSPDVVLCDIGLPDIDGYAVARQLRSDTRTSSIYLIAVSGFASEEDQRRSHDAGFDLHLNKPHGFVGLDERLRRLPIAKR